MAHTPGPWENIGRYGGYQSEIDGAGHAVATVWTKRPGAHNFNEFKESSVVPWPEGEANACLIAAAPDLLATLEDLEWCGQWATTRSCPSCHRPESTGHADDCKLANALTKAKVK